MGAQKPLSKRAKIEMSDPPIQNNELPEGGYNSRISDEDLVSILNSLLATTREDIRSQTVFIISNVVLAITIAMGAAAIQHPEVFHVDRLRPTFVFIPWLLGVVAMGIGLFKLFGKGNKALSPIRTKEAAEYLVKRDTPAAIASLLDAYKHEDRYLRNIGASARSFYFAFCFFLFSAAVMLFIVLFCTIPQPVGE